MKPQQHHLRTREDGALLVLFAILLFGLVALLTLSIDTGFVLLTRRQMQAAVNNASVEGLRWRDQPPPEDPAAILDDDEDSNDLDVVRRAMARHFVRATFDADYDVGTPDLSPTVLGAGPVVGFEGGIDIGGGLKASALLREENLSVYKPVLALNLSNIVSGDMVSGNYLDGDHEECGDGDEECEPYERDDFDPDVDLSNPPDEDNSAFLVRLRRTDEDFSSVPNTSTSGPPIPSLFGRAAIARSEENDPQALLRRRARGIRVRATSIADLRPAISVGTDRNRAGVRYFVDVGKIEVDRSIPVARLEEPDDPLEPVIPCPSSLRGAIVLGDLVALPAPAALPLPSEPFVVAVYVYDSSEDRRIVVGFANYAVGGDDEVVPVDELVGTNGSSTFARTCQLPADSIDFDALMEDFGTFLGLVQGAAVMVPARVRAIR